MITPVIVETPPARSYTATAAANDTYEQRERQHIPRQTYHEPETPRRKSFLSSGYVWGIIIGLVIIAVLVMVFGSHSVQRSTVNREKLETQYGYIADCIDDEVGEIGNSRALANHIQDFWQKTGVQPWIYIMVYEAESDPAVLTLDQRVDLANAYYDLNIPNEAAFLVVFFEDSYGELYLDYTVYTVGQQADAVMDAEACGIFEDFCKTNWYNESLSTDEVFIKAFSQTADRIMDKTTTGLDVAKYIAIVLVIVAAALAVIKVMKTRREHEAERNAETARILNTPLEDNDDVLEKYE